MKSGQLSSFQKQQYTRYLQGQLQKFSNFMLSQRKENERLKLLEQSLAKHEQQFAMLNEKISLLEIYQGDNFKHIEKLKNNFPKDEVLFRLKALEESQRSQSELKCKSLLRAQQQKLEQFLERKYSALQESLSKKLAKLEKDIKQKMNQTPIQIRKSQSPIHTYSSNKTDGQTLASRKELKKLEKKLKMYFSQKLERIGESIKSEDRSERIFNNSQPQNNRNQFQDYAQCTPYEQTEYEIKAYQQNMHKAQIQQGEKTQKLSRNTKLSMSSKQESHSEHHHRKKLNSKSKSKSKSKNKSKHKKTSILQHQLSRASRSRSPSEQKMYPKYCKKMHS